MNETVDTVETAETTPCKHPGCLEPAADQRGIYGLLCEFHKEQKKHLTKKTAKSNGRLDVAERFLAAATALAEAEAAYDTALEAVKRTP